MFEFNDSAFEHGRQDIEGLPPSVKTYRYSNMDDFCQIIWLEDDRLYGSFRVGQKAKAWANTGEKDNTKNTPGEDHSPEEEDHSEHLIFFIEPTVFEHDFINSDPPVRTNTFFNPKTKILIVKMLGPVHEQAKMAFHDMLKLALEPMGLHKAIQSWGNTGMLAIDGTTKQADGGWGPRRPPEALLGDPRLFWRSPIRRLTPSSAVMLSTG
ncbi:uncharacterized protein N7515_008829 [Penicillium bovifimosum]|uniref:Uncharacterized protein n=1 Tax=Penicillium bovifimosum TaxID=126998 RepID=A0A9W9KWR4_9EURO|nr:uncharacterized protein N7515_008829 [Penicillium bovifimosum]KAJ5125004.1 hypothetical protein N7515_008829 [Penicillium bovifimosum]